MTRALMCMLTHSGGSSILAMELGAGLTARGHGITYAHCNEARPHAPGQVYLSADAGNTTAAMLDMPPALCGTIDAGTAFVRAYDAAPFDLVHLHSLQVFGAQALLLKKLRGVPFVVTCHGSDVLSPHFMDANKDVVGYLLSEAAAVTAVSAHVAEVLAHKLPGLPPAHVIHNFPRAAWAAVARPTRGPGTRFLHVSSLRPVKRPELVFESFQLLRRRLPEAALVVVTTGRGLTRAAELCARYGDTGVQIVNGEAAPDALEAAYAEADAFLLTSRFEGFGLVLLEALLHGLPVIAGAVGAVPEVLGPDWPLLVADHTRPEAYAEKMAVAAAAVPDQAAMDRVLARFQPDVQIDAYADLYRRVAAGARGRGVVCPD